MLRVHAFFVAVIIGAVLSPVCAEELIGRYQAHLSSRDHFNSSGSRLTSAAAIIRQDRANFHRFGVRDEGDQWDDFFASKENRALLERMLENGRTTRSVRNRIINGTPMIDVEIYGQGNRGSYVSVTVH